ncbi:MAG: hypothetical protein ACYC2H_08775 [Thermoplasmatota archaeon]
MDRLDADEFMRCLLAAHDAEDAFTPPRQADDGPSGDRKAD